MTSVNSLSGTFSATGVTDFIYFPWPTEKSLRVLSLDFAGVGAARLERRVNGADWKVATDAAGTPYAFTADVECNVEVAPGAQYRLNCTDATAAIAYFFGSPL